MTTPPEQIDLSRTHMVGIGGAGMSGIARILLARGYSVTGSDMKDSRSVLALRAAGAEVAIGHDAANVTGGAELPTVVVTSFAAIPKDNPELTAAREAGIPIVRRSDVLAELMSDRRAFLLAGTHGKTSTTSMAVVGVQAAGLDPSFAIGGQLNRAGTNAHHGTGAIFIAEADESDGSFLSYSPEVAVITNIEPDHLDYYGTEEAYVAIFDEFATKVTPGGYLVCCLDDPGAAALAARVRAAGTAPTVLGYGSRAAADQHPDIPAAAIIEEMIPDARGTAAKVRFNLPGQEERYEDIRVAIPGAHMTLNGVAAITGGALLGADLEKVIAGVADFDGVRRRFEYHGEAGGVRVYDDYAHHPTEVTAVLTAAKELVEATDAGRIIAVFQPHLYSRTMNFASEFARALSLADEVVLLDIFGAREQPVEGVDSRIIGEKLTCEWHFQPDFSAVAEQVIGIAKPGDVVLTIGAGTVTMLADEILRCGREAQGE